VALGQPLARVALQVAVRGHRVRQQRRQVVAEHELVAGDAPPGAEEQRPPGGGGVGFGWGCRGCWVLLLLLLLLFKVMKRLKAQGLAVVSLSLLFG